MASLAPASVPSSGTFWTASPVDSALVVTVSVSPGPRTPSSKGAMPTGCPASKVAPPSTEVNSQIWSKRAPVSP